MQNILLATDFSKNAENALPFAINLVKKLNGKLYLLHAYEYPIFSLKEAFSFDNKVEFLEKIVHGVRLKAHDKLNQIIINNNLSYIKHRALLRKGNVKKEILNAIKINDIDLVIMGTRGAAAEKGFFVKRITKNIIQQASCPVFVVPKSAQFNKISKIVYLSNFKHDETNIINHCNEFAKLYHAHLVILHISDEKNIQHLYNNEVSTLEKQNIEVIKTAIDKFAYHKITYKEIVSKTVIDGINEFIKIDHPDVIVMTTYTSTLFEKLFHKSLTKKMLFHTNIPLMVYNGNLFCE